MQRAEEEAGGREKCCGGRPEQMDPGSLRRTKTCSWPIDQKDRLALPTECTIDFASFSPCFPLFPPFLLCLGLLSGFSSGTWTRPSSFSIPCLRVHMPTDMDGWVTSDCDISHVLNSQNVNIERTMQGKNDTKQRIDFSRSVLTNVSITESADNCFFFFFFNSPMKFCILLISAAVGVMCGWPATRL